MKIQNYFLKTKMIKGVAEKIEAKTSFVRISHWRRKRGRFEKDFVEVDSGNEQRHSTGKLNNRRQKIRSVIKSLM